MTIRRQYSLPNCTLILEGLNDGTSNSGQPDPRPLMSIVVNVECHLAGQPKPLTGGREFLEGLVTSVSNYAQEFLSGIPHPQLVNQNPAVVLLKKGSNKNLHHLILQPNSVTSPVPVASGMGQKPAMPQQVQLDLTTVQLFDLVEAVDQFLADSRTLPDFSVPLKPLPKRYVGAADPLKKWAVPGAVGLTSLAVCAIAFSLVPVPKVQPPEELATPKTEQSKTTPSPTPSTPVSSDIEALLKSVPEIYDPTQLHYLQRKLYNQIDEAWTDRSHFSKNLIYRVGVGKDGAMVVYQPVNEAARSSLQETPIPKLSYLRTDNTNTSSEALAQFKVVLAKGGVLEVSPWNGYKGKPTLGPQIKEPAELSSLKQQLYKQIQSNWKQTATYTGKLVYRVAITKNGALADYEPDNQSAFDYVKETPLPELLKSGNPTGAVPQEPLAQFKVVFKPGGVLEVGRWQ